MKWKQRKRETRNIEIGQRLKQIRMELGLSQRAMGETLNVNSSMFQKYEYGRSMIPIGFLEFCCKKYRISLNWLVAEEGEKYILNQGNIADTLETVYFKEAGELLNVMKNNSVIKYSVLSHFQNLKVVNMESPRE